MANNPIVVLETSKGAIEIELFEEKAPISVKNFLSYVEDGFYTNKIFHRVIDNFMVQGGGFDTSFTYGEVKEPIINEADNGLKNDRGTLAMARTNDPNSATSQFFINVKDNAFLNFTQKDVRGWGYAVFGKVTQGMDIVDKIKETKTGVVDTPYGAMQDVPVEQIVIFSAELKKVKETQK